MNPNAPLPAATTLTRPFGLSGRRSPGVVALAMAVSLLNACGDEIASDEAQVGGGVIGSPTAPGSANDTGNGTAAPGAVDDVGGLGSNGGIDLGTGEAPPAAACIELAVAFEELTTTVVVLVDRSGSMNEDFGNSDRWNVLRDTLIDPANGVIARFQQDVSFGLTMYTSIDGNDGPMGCPILVEVGTALNNFSTIQGVYAGTETLSATSDTPTSESIRAVTQALLASTEPGPKAIILATDGDPDTCEDPDDHSRASQLLSEAAVQDAFALGVRTFVVSVGDQVTQAHLQNLANLGVGSPLDANEPFYQATDAGALVDAFSTIVTSVLPCEFALNGTVAAGDAPSGSVQINGAPITFGEGWDLPNESTVRLLGETCEAFQEGGQQVDISFPCGTFILR